MPIKTAMILAAGRGERLRPITDSIPKPLLQVGPYRLIEYHLYALAKSGFRRVVINISHLGNQIVDFLGDGSRFGISIRYSEENRGALETAGGIHKALDLLDSPEFLVVNGDVYCQMDYSTISLPRNMSMHLVLVINPAHHPKGDFSLDAENAITKVVVRSNMDKTYTFSGIGLYRSSVFEHLIAGKQPLAPLIHEQIGYCKVSGELFEGVWIDVGTEQRLEHARHAAASLSHEIVTESH